MLTNSKSLHSTIHLPNGDTAPITHVGDICLSPEITLHQVLCVPSFHCNLNSISKLTTDSSVSVIFSKNNCVLQDHSLKRMVEIGSAAAGLYNLNHPSSSFQCAQLHTTPSVEAQLWHDRLGHPAATILNKIVVTTSVDSKLFSTCDVCLRAKQHVI